MDGNVTLSKWIVLLSDWKVILRVIKFPNYNCFSLCSQVSVFKLKKVFSGYFSLIWLWISFSSFRSKILTYSFFYFVNDTIFILKVTIWSKIEKGQMFMSWKIYSVLLGNEIFFFYISSLISLGCLCTSSLFCVKNLIWFMISEYWSVVGIKFYWILLFSTETFSISLLEKKKSAF